MPAAELVEPPSFQRAARVEDWWMQWPNQHTPCWPRIFASKLGSRICCFGGLRQWERSRPVLPCFVRRPEQAGFCVTCPIALASRLALRHCSLHNCTSNASHSQSAAAPQASLHHTPRFLCKNIPLPVDERGVGHVIAANAERDRHQRRQRI